MKRSLTDMLVFQPLMFVILWIGHPLLAVITLGLRLYNQFANRYSRC